MAGNSKRQGAIRKTGSKKGAQVGSGGQRRKGLEPKGPTPPASERTGHPAARRSARAARERAAAPRNDMVAGRNPVLEALRAEVPATALIVMSGMDADERVTAAINLAAERGLPVQERSKAEMGRLATGMAHQGVLLEVGAYDYADWDDLLADADAGTLLVALDGITDPHNLGAIARSAAAFGARGLVVPARRSAGVSPAAWKSSAGTLAQLPVAKVTNTNRAVSSAQDAGFFAIGLDGRARIAIAEAAAQFADVPTLIVVGGEGSGLSRLVAERVDVLAGIPMAGRAESLNASVAAGVALYAAMAARA